MKQKLLNSLRLRVCLLVAVMAIAVNGAWAGDYTLTISTDELDQLTSGSGYATYNGEHTTEAVSTTDPSKTYSVTWVSYQVMISGGEMQWQKSAGYIYNKTDLGTISNVTVTSSQGTFTTKYGTSQEPTGSTVGGGYFKTSIGSVTGNASKIEVLFTIDDSSIPTPSSNTVALTSTNLELTGSYTTNTEKTIDGITYCYTDLMISNERIQAKASSGTISNKTAFPNNISSVAITHSGTARATTINGSADGENWTQVATGNGSITADFSGKGYKYFQITRGSNAAYWTQIVITLEAASSTPSISANDIEIACDATSGSTPYTINNPAADGSFSVPNDGTWPDWISSISWPNNTLTVACSQNTSTTARTATITLVYTYNNGTETVTKDVTITQTGEKEDAVIVVQDDNVEFRSTYTVDNTMIEGGDITVTSSNTAIATVNGLTITPVAVGTTTITVSTAENDDYKAGSETFELTVTAPEGKTTAATGGFVKVTSTADITNGQYLIVYEDGNVAFNGGLETLDGAHNNIEVNINDSKIAANNVTEAAAFTIDVTNGTIKSASGMYIGVNSNNNGLKQTDDASTYTNSFEIDEDGDAVIAADFEGSTMSLKFNSASGDSNDRFRYYKSGQQAIQLYKLNEVNLTTTLSATTGYATYCSEYPLDFSDDSEFSAWEITNIEGTTITFKQINGSVKGGTGVFLMGEKGATVTLTSANSSTVLGDNYLEGTLAPTYIEANKYYGLSGQNFVKVNAGTVPAGKALLPASEVNTTGGVKSFTFIFDGADGIRTVETVSAEEAQAIFNLAGQRLPKAQRGVNIVNGKKVVLK